MAVANTLAYYDTETITGLHSNCMLLALPANITQGQK
jgi:hypothetical protein